ncbi:MAG TPA: deoxynucleoside kinase, partial [Burkholderiales bacterium]|nr:deoxynucleoside kinase [Burkholderiales bacterium]
MERLRYIAVEGPIGAGKTSLARRLAARLGADLLLEQPGENPFLARFYRDMARYALPTQLFFLFQRSRMLEPLAQPDMFGRSIVGDFLLDKDPLFARLTLSADELALYQKIYDALRPRAPTPDLVIYLQAPSATLIERVRRRAAAFERGIDEEYLALLAESYARFFY